MKQNEERAKIEDKAGKLQRIKEIENEYARFMDLAHDAKTMRENFYYIRMARRHLPERAELVEVLNEK